VTTTVPLEPAALRSAIYRQYGAYPDTSGVVEDRTGTLDRLADTVASSMLQQHARLLDLSQDILQGVIDELCPPQAHAEDWDLAALRAAIKERFGFLPTIDEKSLLDREPLTESIWAEVEKVIDAREAEFTLPVLLHFSRYFYLEEIDGRWIDHLKTMEALRDGIGLRGYGQKDPKQEYKKEGFDIFGEMMTVIGRNVCEKLFHVQIKRDDPPPVARPKPQRKMVESGGDGGAGEAPAAAAKSNGTGGDGERPVRRGEPKVGRNDPCPCGSGKKYKKCHGAQPTA
jgi:preprotein translocase subunit SecA